MGTNPDSWRTPSLLGRASPIHRDRFQTAFSWSDLIYVLDVPETCRCYPGHSRVPIRRIVMREYFFSLPRLCEVGPESFEEAVKATECASYMNSLLDVTTTELAVRDVPERPLAMSPETDPRSMLAWFAIAEA